MRYRDPFKNFKDYKWTHEKRININDFWINGKISERFSWSQNKKVEKWKINVKIIK